MEGLGTGSIAKPSSAASLKSSLGFIADSFDTFRPSAASVVTVSSSAFASFSIRPSPYLCWILRQNRRLNEPFAHRSPESFGENKVESLNFNLDFTEIIKYVVFGVGKETIRISRA